MKPHRLNDETIEKLKELLKQDDEHLTDSIIEPIQIITYQAFFLHHGGNNGIINQDALDQLISAFEALGERDQRLLIEQVFMLQNIQPNHEKTGFYTDLVLRAAKSCSQGNSDKSPSPFEGIEQFLEQNMKRVFDRMPNPEGDRASLLKTCMEIVLADPVFVGTKKCLAVEQKLGDVLFEEKLPKVVTGNKIHSTYAELRERKDKPRQDEWKKYPTFLDDYFGRNPKHSITEGKRACAAEYGVSLKTIQRHTSGYEKPGTD
ncbi:hypothetical protein PDESU_05805 [Pontiella desulfatans]|uniref:Uncharacterized protein n=1 Tax=Pontiella desulfatans TaxID=2750659 RepID=A0A6C2UB97_PONDE|nr:hypothetical protein [Pontiella desulfatans]VGO17209.1 hypothetical protein PDESU_05805 [Pontiella desulfatans]